MKICPACQSQYTDDTLNFCLQDGTALVARAAPTVAYNEQETIVASRPTNPPAGGYQGRAAFDQPAPKTRSGLLVAALLFGALALIVFGAVGLWIVISGRTPYSRPNPLVANTSTDRPVSTAPLPSPTVAANTVATPAFDAVRVRTEVTARIEEWRSGIESVDLDRFMENYAGTVDYYNRRTTSKSAVREDKRRAFDKFDSMRMTISALKITVGSTGNTATAVFDKQWSFANSAGDRTGGKVSQQLNLEKIGGKWLITAEKDLKVIE